jgi:hypothetical protein
MRDGLSFVSQLSPNAGQESYLHLSTIRGERSKNEEEIINYDASKSKKSG